ncbi:ATP-binding protein [Burkholderia sp. 9120]|jgi:hypothetical protein|uniref:AlbA family DNA-binding domain-containing protein n=1 Tax=Burkholderia sp. 9120 TaxID=1500897 RepID=UPI0005558B09|nr:ATP-binding protein [Burkholderia sp. 9120]
MTDDELIQRIATQEDNFVERKPPGVNRSEIRQTLSAFANSVPSDRTAVLFIGVHDRTGKIIGVPVDQTDSKQKLIREIAEKDCYPPIKTVTCRVLAQDGLHIVAVMVSASEDRPHFTGPAYVRRGSESVNASPELFKELIAGRSSKVRAILDMRGRTISFQSIGHKIGDTSVVSDVGFRQGGECVVEACDMHVVHLNILNNGMAGRSVAEPIEHVEVNYDYVKHRPMLVVRGR